MRNKLRPDAGKETVFTFFAEIKDQKEVQLLRQANAQLGYASNATLLHLLAAHYLKTTDEAML
jgi:hypothetical protein